MPWSEIRKKKTNIREEGTSGRAAWMVWIKINRHTACDWPLKIISFGSPRKKKNGEEEQPKSSLSNQYRIVTPTFQYNMDYKKVGKCIIINNKNFEDKTGNVISLMILITDFRIFILSLSNKYFIFRTWNFNECINLFWEVVVPTIYSRSLTLVLEQLFAASLQYMFQRACHLAPPTSK